MPDAPAPPLALHRLAPADAPALRALRLEAFAAHARAFRSSPEEERAIPLADLEESLGRDVWLGLIDGEALVGAASLAREPRAKLAHKAVIRGVYVRPPWRRRGGGEALLRGLLAAVPAGVERLSLIVSDGAGPALRLYARLGFVWQGAEPRALKLADGTYVDEVTMAKAIEPDRAAAHER